MITLTQMEALTGVSRRMLQDYHKLGLLPYRGKTPGGYWLYAEEDVDKLAVIQLLRNFGFSRKEIRDVFDNPDATFPELMDRAEAALLEQRRRIDQLLRQVSLIRLQHQLPPEAIAAAGPLLRPHLGKDCTVQSLLEDAMIEDSVNLQDPDVAQVALTTCYLPIFSSLKAEPHDSPEVQQHVAALHRLNSAGKPTSPDEFADLMAEMAENPQFDQTFGEGTGAYMMRCIRHYCACAARASGNDPSAATNEP